MSVVIKRPLRDFLWGPSADLQPRTGSGATEEGDTDENLVTGRAKERQAQSGSACKTDLYGFHARKGGKEVGREQGEENKNVIGEEEREEEYMYDKGVLQSGTHWGYGLTEISSPRLDAQQLQLSPSAAQAVVARELEFAAQRQHSGKKTKEERQEDLQGKHELDRPETSLNATAVDRLKNLLRQERVGGLWRSPLLQPSTSSGLLPILLQEEAEGDLILLQEEAEGDANLLGEKAEEGREEQEVELDPDTMMPIHKGCLGAVGEEEEEEELDPDTMMPVKKIRGQKPPGKEILLSRDTRTLA